MSGLFANFPIGGTVPNLILLMVIFSALEEDSFDPYFVAILGGLLLDVSLGISPGSFLIGFILLVFLVQLIFQQIVYQQFEQKYLPALVIVAQIFLFVWLWSFNSLGTNFHWSQSGLGTLSLWRKFLPNLFYTLLLMYPVYWLVGWIRSLISREINARSF